MFDLIDFGSDSLFNSTSYLYKINIYLSLIIILKDFMSQTIYVSIYKQKTTNKSLNLAWLF